MPWDHTELFKTDDYFVDRHKRHFCESWVNTSRRWNESDHLDFRGTHISIRFPIYTYYCLVVYDACDVSFFVVIQYISAIKVCVCITMALVYIYIYYMHEKDKDNDGIPLI